MDGVRTEWQYDARDQWQCVLPKAGAGIHPAALPAHAADEEQAWDEVPLVLHWGWPAQRFQFGRFLMPLVPLLGGEAVIICHFDNRAAPARNAPGHRSGANASSMHPRHNVRHNGVMSRGTSGAATRTPGYPWCLIQASWRCTPLTRVSRPLSCSLCSGSNAACGAWSTYATHHEQRAR